MATGSGLDSQVGLKAESVYGTAVTVDRFYEHNGYSVKRIPVWNEPPGQRKGRKYKVGSRTRQARTALNGELNLTYATKGFGPLWKQALGSSITTPTQIAATTAYKQIHTPGDHLGKSLTIQAGLPEASGTVVPKTHAGCKVTGWEFAITDAASPTLKLTIVGRSETLATALASAAYPTGLEVFDFSQVTMKLGGTATTASGETTVASGVAVATIVKSCTITSSVPMDVQRYGLGNAGLMAEPLENDIPTITGSLSAEWNRLELYDLFTNQTRIPLQVDLTGPAIGVSGSNNLLSFICPEILVKDAPSDLNGPGVVQMTTSFEAYLDATGNPVVQVKVVSDETTL